MTLRFGFLMIGTALGLLPLSGCVGWGRNTVNTNPDRQHAVNSAIPFPRVESAVQTPSANTPASTETMSYPPPEPVPSEKLPVGPPNTAQESDDIKPATQLTSAKPEQKKTEAEPTPREPVVEALTCLMQNRHNDALECLRAYDQATQEVFLRLLPMLKLLAQKSIDQWTATEVSLFDEEMKSLSDALRPRSEFSIGAACFCDSIESYGIYKRLPDDHDFVASTRDFAGEKVLLYVELRNFMSEFRKDYFATWLESSLEIRDQKNEKIWSYTGFPEEKVPIQSRTLLHDYCNKYHFYVPIIPAGNYKLTIQIKDKTRPDHPRIATKTLDFRVTTMPTQSR